MTDIVLVHPAGHNWTDGLEKTIHSANRMAPLGLMSLSSWLKRHGYSVKILDFCATMPTAEDSFRQIVEHHLSYVGFSCTTSSFLDGYSIAERIKQELPDTTIVFGGVHVSSQREKILQQFPAIDVVVVGEGEEAFHQLVSGDELSSIKGLAYRDGDKSSWNGFRPDALDLDSLPFPDYAGLDNFPKDYNLPLFNYPRAPNTTMITSRGCPFQCFFCDRSVFRKGFRFNSAQYIYEHLRYLKTDYGIRHINIYDDLFTYDRSRILDLSGLLIRKPLELTYNCAVRSDTLDDELLTALKKSGCWMISLGIESGDQKVLQQNKTTADLENLKQSIVKIRSHGLRVKGLFIWGLPGETEESIRNTRDFIFTLPLDDINISKFSPFPGAPIYRVLDKFGEMEEDWNKMNCMNFVFRPTGIASLERLEELYNSFIRDYYERPSMIFNYLKMIWISPHSWLSLLRSFPAFLSARKHFHAKTVVIPVITPVENDT